MSHERGPRLPGRHAKPKGCRRMALEVAAWGMFLVFAAVELAR